ncbi:MAG: hypothetical protein ACRDKV_09290, partial [Solirubrobacterales bacterium]
NRFLGSVAFPLVARGLGRALGRRFDSDISVKNISRAGLEAIKDTLGRLGVDAEHVVFGHTHRPGPLDRDDPSEWRLANGTRIYGSGSWTYSPGLCGPTSGQSIFWPGTVTWVGDEGPPERRELLAGRTHTDLGAAARRIAEAGG